MSRFPYKGVMRMEEAFAKEGIRADMLLQAREREGSVLTTYWSIIEMIWKTGLALCSSRRKP